VLVAVVILTLPGLFSRGPLSTVEAVSEQGDLKVEYERTYGQSGTHQEV